jgi:hypothetical protein
MDPNWTQLYLWAPLEKPLMDAYYYNQFSLKYQKLVFSTFSKYCNYFDILKNKINITLSHRFFFFISHWFYYKFKGYLGQYYIWHQLNIIKKNPCMHRHVDSPRFVKAAYARLFNHQKLPFREVFRRSNPLHDVVACWQGTSLVWYEQPYPLIFFSLSSLLELSVNPFKN